MYLFIFQLCKLKLYSIKYNPSKPDFGQVRELSGIQRLCALVIRFRGWATKNLMTNVHVGLRSAI